MNARRTGYWLRKWADRIDPHGAPRATGHAFTFEMRRGLVFRDDGKGCPLWYYGRDDYERAHNEADNPGPRVDWVALSKGRL